MDIFKRAEIGARWMRDSFASWFTTSWLYLLAWTIVLTAFVVLAYLDGHFSHSLAVGSSIAPVAFMAMGFVFRLFAALFLMASERAKLQARFERKWPEPEYRNLGIMKLRKKQDWERRGKVWRRLGFAVSLLVCAHAVGIGLEALDNKRDTALADKGEAQILVDGDQAKVDRLQERIAKKEAERDAALAGYTAEIRQYITDGLNNDELADDTRALREAARAEFKADIDALEADLETAQAALTTTEVAGNEKTADKDEWAPLFVGLAQFVTWNQEPTDWAIYLVAVGFIIFWVLNAEAIVIFLPKEIYKMHVLDAQKAKDSARSEAARKGWETRREKEDANSDELQIEDKGYWESRIIKAVNTGYKTRKIAGMCQTYFGTIEPGQLREHLKRQIDAHLELPKADPKKHKRAIERGLLSDERKTYLMQDHIDFIFSEGAFAPEQKEEAPKANGQDLSPLNGATDDSTDDSQSTGVPAA